MEPRRQVDADDEGREGRVSAKKEWYETFVIVEPSRSRSFPLDMLRYSSCVPARETDSHAIESERGARVLLRRFSRDGSVRAPAAGESRWESFGWKVVAHISDREVALHYFETRE